MSTTAASPLSLTSLGAAGTVTGSKHLLESDRAKILVDCGLFQGLKNLRELNWARLPLDPTELDAVVLTHAHLDHCGYLPRLVRDGFKGRIYATPATRDVAELILKDSAHLQEMDADHLNRTHRSKHSPALPLYTTADAERALEAFTVRDFHESFTIAGDVTVRFRRAGHILGAATVDLEMEGRRIAFSGDLGRSSDPLMHAPEAVPRADYVVVESTYGDRLHADVDPAEELLAVTERTVARGGTLVIPAFAIGRAQTLLYWFWQLRRDGRLPDVPIHLDSPMAINASGLLARHPADHRLGHELAREVCAVAAYARTPEESRRLSASRSPKVIISASGMATGGRILHHLQAFGTDPRNTVLLVGYQSAGTRGRTLQQGGRDLKLYGEWVHVRAEVADLAALSAHADADELMAWLSGFASPVRQAFVVHGEAQPAETLRARIGRELGWSAVVPRQNQRFSL